MKVKVNGYKIRSHRTGKLYPKVYKTAKAANRRIGQMKRFGKKKSTSRGRRRRRKHG
jgi:hypothetical protein